jgi:hypothetical protein
MMLRGSVSLGDVRDVENFVGKTLRKTRLRFTADEFEELLCEGIVIMYQLHDRWDGRGRYSGYASMYLPKRLGAAWHKLHPEHVEVSDASGKRTYEYREPATSLNQHIGGHDDGHDKRELLLRTPGDFVVIPAQPASRTSG